MGKSFIPLPCGEDRKTGKLFMKSTIYPENMFEPKKIEEFPVFPWGFVDLVVLLPFSGWCFNVLDF